MAPGNNRAFPSIRRPTHDVLIVGGGPAGAVCAAFCARGGLRTLVLERCLMPRDKVCGDCLNPAAWPILDRLGITARILASPHAKLRHVEFIGLKGIPIRVPLDSMGHGEIAIRRSILDALLLAHAGECGAEIAEELPVTRVERQEDRWVVRSEGESYTARFLVAADGRNSTVARLLGLLPPASRDRVGLQTHWTTRGDGDPTVTLRLLPTGYCGTSPVGASGLNVCLVSRPETLGALRAWAEATFGIPKDHAWRTIAPLARAPIPPEQDRLLLVGDAARVVEPFTGEGIHYAIASGELASRFLLRNDLQGYAKAHASLYAGRLWINRLAKWAVTHPQQGTFLLGFLRPFPPLLRFITRRIVRPESVLADASSTSS